MTPIPVRTKGADRVIGHLYGLDDLDVLSEDMLNVKVGEYGIDVGWYPEADPQGRYVVRVYRGRFSNLLQSPFTTRDPIAVKKYVESEIAGRSKSATWASKAAKAAKSALAAAGIIYAVKRDAGQFRRADDLSGKTPQSNDSLKMAVVRRRVRVISTGVVSSDDRLNYGSTTSRTFVMLGSGAFDAPPPDVTYVGNSKSMYVEATTTLVAEEVA